MRTPGPWQVDPCADASGFATIRRADGTENGDTESQPIATVYSDGDMELVAHAPAMFDLIVEFCRRVEAGEVRSRRTYAKFKAIIAAVENSK